ncbi:hypothetical protein PF005_g22764, partial [Phytophthora fragariae]
MGTMLGRRRELLKDPVDELKLLRREDQRERVLLTNIKRTLRCSSRRARPTRPRWSSTASTTMVATCTKTTFL